MINHWMLAAIAIGAGLLIGEIAGRIARGTLSRADRSPESREMARPVATFVFWASTAVGVVVGLLAASPAALRDLPRQVVDTLPRLLIAFVLVLAGYAIGIALAAAVGQSALRASGVRHRGLERMLRVAVMTAFVVAALSQLGVNTTILVVILAAATGAPALAVALLTAFGGRDVAAAIAAGRALRGRIEPGQRLIWSGGAGTVASVTATTVEVMDDADAVVHVPLTVLATEPFTVVAPVRQRGG